MATSKYIINKYAAELANYGRGLMSVKYPSDIEMYLVGMELVDSAGRTEQYFVFPIMPNSISKTEQNRTNIKKSSSGTTVLMSPSHAPSEINIKGDFGRSFKILTNPKDESNFSFGIFKDKSKDKFKVEVPELDVNIKSGYGAIKILQGMVKKTNELDGENKPYRLYFYNMALGESYLVSILPGAFSLSQSYEMNMIWGYNLTMNVIAPLDSLKSSEKMNKSSKSLLGAKTIQNSVNVLVSSVLNLL